VSLSQEILLSQIFEKILVSILHWFCVGLEVKLCKMFNLKFMGKLG